MIRKPVSNEPSYAAASPKLIHDLKNDLAILVASCELLNDVTTTEAQKNHINLLLTGIRRLKQHLADAVTSVQREDVS
jgi:hypothetical protein